MSFSNSYTNAAYGTNRYDESTHSDLLKGSSYQPRAGGHGDFYDNTVSVPAEPEQGSLPTQTSFRRQGTEHSIGGSGLFASGRRDTDEYDSSRSRDRGGRSQDTRLQRNAPGGKQIEGVLENIHSNWDILIRDDCIPVHVALQLMDYSSLGRANDYQDFQRTYKHLQKALKTIVNEHHQGFNSSIGTFHKIQASIQASQNRVRALRDSVQGAKSNLMVINPELKGLGTSSQKYDDMIAILGQIEKLQLVPEQLDAQISEKHFLSAVDLLQDALRIIRRSDLENLGALTDLRIYFSNQETSLVDILIEELHDHLYLKSPYCHDRWMPYGGGLTNLVTSPREVASLPNTWGRLLYTFLDSLDSSSGMEDDASRDPEANSFQFIRMIIESLNKLGHLDIAINRMEQRLPIELFAIVDRTNQEVNTRQAAYTKGPCKSDERNLAHDFDNSSSHSVLSDLLWTLYSKFQAIAEGHRAVYETVACIVKREGLRHSEKLLRGFQEMWKLYQSEVSYLNLS